MTPARTLPFLLLLAAAGCDFGAFEIYDPPGAAPVGVTFVLKAEDTEAAGLLGWENARVPEAEIVLEATDPERTWRRTGNSSSSGEFVVDSIPPGEYQLTVRRLLSDAERGRAGGVNAFVATAAISFGAEGGTLEIPVAASRPGSLMISEIYDRSLLCADNRLCYNHGGFWELYNNADTTVYLDGVTIALRITYDRNITNFPCASTAPMQLDPAGLWSFMFETVPGSGRQYPLAPGHTAVIATDAIDHRPINAEAPDLSRAEFESVGNADVDNPNSVNLINTGILTPPDGRGLRDVYGTTFIASPVDIASLPRGRHPTSTLEFKRFPAASILDVFVRNYSPPGYDELYGPLCGELTHPSFNRGVLETYDFRRNMDRTWSMQRRPLYTLPDGRVVLQQTRHSVADWMFAARSPGTVPK